MAGALFRTVAVLLLSALVFIAMLNGLAHLLVYHPHPYRAGSRPLTSADLVELPFKIPTGEQTSFYIPPHDGAVLPNRLWVLFCGNGSLALDWLPLVARDQNAGDAFLLIDYPGYGKSRGWPNIDNTGAAAEGALVALAARLAVPPKALETRINTMGHSLGAAAALDFASRHPQVGRIVLLAPFTSLREEAAVFIGSQLSHLLMANYDNRAALLHLSQREHPPRVAIFHGLEDGMIPPEMGRALASEFPSFVTFRGIADANHDTVVLAAEDEILSLLANDGKQRPAR